MRSRFALDRCCCKCNRFADELLRCTGDFTSDSGDPDDIFTKKDGTCTEAINGFDATRKWWTDRDGIWTHYNLRFDHKNTEAWIQADVPSGLVDNPRMFCTVPLPYAFSMGVITSPPAAGDMWRLGWLQPSGAAFAVEVNGPTGDCAGTYKVLDMSCFSSGGSGTPIDNREIPFEFLGPRNRSMSLGVCVNEFHNLLVVDMFTYSEIYDEEKAKWFAVPWNYAHNLPYASLDVDCTKRLYCYPSWIEVGRTAGKSYEFGPCLDFDPPDGKADDGPFFSISKAKGNVFHPDARGNCECNALGFPLFSDDFNRDAEILAPLIPNQPHDSTGHLWHFDNPWEVTGQELKTSIPGFSNNHRSTMRIIDHFVTIGPSGFGLFGWAAPLTMEIKVKVPAGGVVEFMLALSGYRVRLETGSSAKLKITQSTSFAPGSLKTSKDVADVPGGDEWYTLRLCWNGKFLWGFLVTPDAREYSVHIGATDIPTANEQAICFVPSHDDGNVSGDYLFDDFIIWAATNLIDGGGSGSGSGSGSGGGLDITDHCGCCGPFGCPDRNEHLFIFPPHAGILTSCFWESGSAVVGGSAYRWKGSYSGQKGGKHCDLDQTYRVDLSFNHVTSNSGHVRVSIGGVFAMITWTSGTAVLTLSGGTPYTSPDPILIGGGGGIQICAGMGNLTVSALGVQRQGRMGILSTMERIDVEFSGVDVANVRVDEINHGLYLEKCPACWGGKYIPCDKPELMNCKDGIVSEAGIATVEADFDIMDDPCCLVYQQALSSGIIIKNSDVFLASEASVSCCFNDQITMSSSIGQCTYSWGGSALINCEFVGNPDLFQIGVALQRYPEGYRLCGLLRISGTGPGSAVQGTFTGVSDVISPPDKPPDCTSMSGTINMNCYSPNPDVPATINPPCGMSNVKILFSTL